MIENSGNSTTSPPLRKRVLIASVWAISTRWGSRLLGLVSVAVLARLLTPDDFGVIAAVMAVYVLVDSLTVLGIDWALIQNHNDDKKLYDTAWTIRLIKNFVLAALLVVLSPFMVQYTNDPRVASIIWVLAIGILIKGFENMGVIQFRKELDFRKEFIFLIVPKASTVALSIIAAIILRSYWALVIGFVSKFIIQVIISYWMHPMRPRLSLSRFNQIWSFSRWMVLFNFGNSIFRSFDRLFLAGLLPKDRLAFFTVGTDVSSIVTVNVLLPVRNVLMPSFAKLKQEKDRLRQAYIKSMGLLITLALPITVGASLVSNELTLLFLGDQWNEAVQIIGATTLSMLFLILVNITSPLMLMAGMAKHAGLLSLLFAFFFIAALSPVYSTFGIIGLIVLKGALAFLRFLWQIKITFSYLEEPLSTLWMLVQRPLLATLLMYLAIDSVSCAFLWPLLCLIQKGIIGAFVFGTSLFILWGLSGRPDGFEAFALEMLRKNLPAKWRSETR